MFPENLQRFSSSYSHELWIADFLILGIKPKLRFVIIVPFLKWIPTKFLNWQDPIFSIFGLNQLPIQEPLSNAEKPIQKFLFHQNPDLFHLCPKKLFNGIINKYKIPIYEKSLSDLPVAFFWDTKSSFPSRSAKKS